MHNADEFNHTRRLFRAFKSGHCGWYRQMLHMYRGVTLQQYQDNNTVCILKAFLTLLFYLLRCCM